MATFQPPADWPKIIILSGSPPKAAILLHPFQGKLVVQSAVIAEVMSFAVQGRMREEAHQVHAIIERHDDGTALLGKFAPIVIIALAVGIAAAIAPEHDRQFLIVLMLALPATGVNILR